MGPRGADGERRCRRPPVDGWARRSRTSPRCAARPQARRGLEVALAGGHGLLLIGPPGRARPCSRGPSRVCCRRSTTRPRWPRRSSHPRPARVRSTSCAADRRSGHRITPSRMRRWSAAGPHLSPGEVTLADQGVLFLDELPEFERDVLEALRQPLEEGRVAIARAGRATIFPARFQLVAAMNPCPCGFAGTSDRAVSLSAARPGALPAPGLGTAARPDRPVDRDAARRAGGARRRTGPGRARPSSPSGSPPPGRLAFGRQPGAQRAADRPDPARGMRARWAGPARRLVGLAEMERASGRGTERILRVARTIADLAGIRAVRPEPPRGGRLVPPGRPAARCSRGGLTMLGRRAGGAGGERGAFRAMGRRGRSAESGFRRAGRRPMRSATRGRSWRPCTDSVRSGSRALLARYGTGLAILREASSPGGVERLATADEGDTGRVTRDITPEVAEAIARAAAHAGTDPRADPRARHHGRDRRGPASTRSAWQPSRCRPTCCTSRAIRPR